MSIQTFTRETMRSGEGRITSEQYINIQKQSSKGK